MNIFDNIYIQEISEKDYDIFWENESDNNNSDDEKYKFYDNWFNNYFLRDINKLYENKAKEIKDLPISKYIIEILNIKISIK